MTISAFVEVIVVDGLLFSISDTECCGIYDFIFFFGLGLFCLQLFNLSGLSKSQHATAPTNSQSNTESWKLY